LTAVTSSQFVSYAQNREDVVLNRALAGVARGRYVQVGAHDRINGSVTYAFYERGWSGIAVESDPAAAEKLRVERPRDIVIQECRRVDGVLEEAGWAALDIHVMVVDGDAVQRGDLKTVDLTRWRPWIVVIEHPEQVSEDNVFTAGYEFCLFDGLSRFYVAAEKAAELRPALSAPANPRDDYVLHATRVAEQQRDEAVAEMHRRDEKQQATILSWRAAALRAWATSAEVAQEQDLRKQIDEHLNHVRHVDEQLAQMRRTLSWRVTRPLRGLRTVARRRGVL
jgi:hypothetical protein